MQQRAVAARVLERDLDLSPRTRGNALARRQDARLVRL
jgi:hypothetical protein